MNNGQAQAKRLGGDARGPSRWDRGSRGVRPDDADRLAIQLATIDAGPERSLPRAAQRIGVLVTSLEREVKRFSQLEWRFEAALDRLWEAGLVYDDDTFAVLSERLAVPLVYQAVERIKQIDLDVMERPTE